MTRKPGAATVLVACVILMTAGCAGSGEVSGNEPPTMEPVVPDYEDQARDRSRELKPEQPWRCGYAPTYDDDWHNDVLCTNGVDRDRPYLREGDSFVTYEEIMGSARIYERQLNAQGSSADSSPRRSRWAKGTEQLNEIGERWSR